MAKDKPLVVDLRDSTLKIGIQSRVSTIDVSGLIIECPPKHMMSQRAVKGWDQVRLDTGWDGRDLVSMGFISPSGPPWTEEHVRIAAMIPWLDGARECVETIYFWQHAL